MQLANPIIQKIKISKSVGGAYRINEKVKTKNEKLGILFVLFTLFLGIFYFGNVSSVQAGKWHKWQHKS